MGTLEGYNTRYGEGFINMNDNMSPELNASDSNQSLSFISVSSSRSIHNTSPKNTQRINIINNTVSDLRDKSAWLQLKSEYKVYQYYNLLNQEEKILAFYAVIAILMGIIYYDSRERLQANPNNEEAELVRKVTLIVCSVTNSLYGKSLTSNEYFLPFLLAIQDREFRKNKR